MKAYKVEMLVVDHDGLGGEGIKDELENTKYSNRGIAPQVMFVEGKDIDEWSDDHPLNFLGCNEEYQQLFSNN